MLYNFDHGPGKPVNTAWSRAQYRLWLGKLARIVHPLAIMSVKQWVHIELADGIVTTSWMPGEDWNGTPYQALYDALQDEQWAAMFFGLIVEECVIERCAATGEDWGYGHYKKDGIPIKGRTYFRLQLPFRKAV